MFGNGNSFRTKRKRLKMGKRNSCVRGKAKAVEEKLFLRRQKMGNADIARRKENRLTKNKKLTLVKKGGDGNMNVR